VFDRLLHSYLRALPGPRACRVGPFLAASTVTTPACSATTPSRTTAPTPLPGEIAVLISTFVERGRTPRLEYLPGRCPLVEPALRAAGFVPERRVPVMTCAPHEAVGQSAPEGIGLALAGTEEQLRQVAEAQNEAYGRPDPTGNDVARLRATVDRGGLAALAADLATGRVVGGGLCAPPHCGVSELAAVGVRPGYRRRGIASALTALLTTACPTVGITSPFLTPAGDAEERIYRRAGYRPVTEMLHISRPVTAS
jgi:GNAT superfamily N-acetyltransferase